MKVHECIDGRLRQFIEAQHVFFVATAPLAADGHVNVSPKGMGGTFTVVDEHTVAYLDLTGSGAETIAHLRENGRVTLMFCAFEGPPNIVRLHG
ncbi:MAG: pyridoxamine 5'-phosphate oxidase family protein, partial [Dermatophilaceae bacterium]|nr:pyridoxamine 5'-phosphate oxidase family protein [Dermatophilaceae bacterium]